MAQRVKADINVYQGDTRGYKFTFYTDAAHTTAWNFSAASQVRLAVKQTLDSATELFHVDATNGQNGNDWANGIAVFTIPATDSADLVANGKYDVQITISSAPVTPVYGDVLLQRQVNS